MNSVHMQRAIALSREGMTSGQGGPFGAVIVRDDRVVAEGFNQVHAQCDPTAHAEMVAIRAAAQILGSLHLIGCEIYTSCEPCPMCLGAIYWAGLERMYYGNSRADAAAVGFSDNFIYVEIPLSVEGRSIPGQRLLPVEAQAVFVEWQHKVDAKMY